MAIRIRRFIDGTRQAGPRTQRKAGIGFLRSTVARDRPAAILTSPVWAGRCSVETSGHPCSVRLQSSRFIGSRGAGLSSLATSASSRRLGMGIRGRLFDRHPEFRSHPRRGGGNTVHLMARSAAGSDRIGRKRTTTILEPGTLVQLDLGCLLDCAVLIALNNRREARGLETVCG